jgi:hypothetical protein
MRSLTRTAMSFDQTPYVEVKDPCPVFDGIRWQLFGTGVTRPHVFEILRATAPRVTGPWLIQAPISLGGITGGCVGAPGVIAEDGLLHMFVQTEYNRVGGTIEHLISADCGATFRRRPTALAADPGKREAGIYDPHPAVINGERLLVYSAFSVVGQPDLHLARSTGDTWDGPWERLGPILSHEQVPWHNQRGHEAYEWGLEGAQLLLLPDGRILLNAVGFQTMAPIGTRQRVFLAVGPAPTGPFTVGEPAITPIDGNGSGENGHATVVIDGDHLALVFQERDAPDGRWRYALATAPIIDTDQTDVTWRAA